MQHTLATRYLSSREIIRVELCALFRHRNEQKDDLGSLGGIQFEDHLEWAKKFERGGEYYRQMQKDRKTGVAGPKFWSRGMTEANYKDIFAIGDIHGDLLSLLSSLFLAKVIDKRGRWIARNTLVIQLGDILDRKRPGLKARHSSYNPREEIDIIQYMFGLDFEARLVGSRIISLCGNHDLWPIEGPRSSSRKDYVGYSLQVYGGIRKRDAYFRSDGMRNYMAIYRPPIIKASEWLAMHGGISERNFMKGITTLKKLIQSDQDPLTILGNQWVEGMTHPRKPFPKFIMDAMYNRYWASSRNATKHQTQCSDHLGKMLHYFGIDGDGGLLLGHTPMWIDEPSDFHTVEVVCNRRCIGDACGVILADVAQSEGFHIEEDRSSMSRKDQEEFDEENMKSTSVAWIVRDRKQNKSVKMKRICSGIAERGEFRIIETYDKSKQWSVESVEPLSRTLRNRISEVGGHCELVG